MVQPHELMAAAGAVGVAMLGFLTGHYSRRDARRLSSGSVATTDATQLWQQDVQFRTTLLDRIDALEALVSRYENERVAREEENRRLRRQVEKLEGQVLTLDLEVQALRAAAATRESA